MRTQIINSDVVIAYSHCPRKAFLLHCAEDRGTPNDYAGILEERASVNRAAYLATLQRAGTPTCSYRNEVIPVGAEVLTEAKLEATNVGAYCDALRIVGQSGESVDYEPTIVVGTYRVEKKQILNLSVIGYVLQQLHGTPPATGVVVTLDGGFHRVNLRLGYKTVTSIIESIRGWCKDPPMPPPPVILNRHCPSCPFKNVCAQHAQETDDLSLLDRMTPKAMRRYHNKGIFTVKQLSFVFKPRRRRRRRAAPPAYHNFEVQALAIRTGKTYIQTVPEIRRNDIELFLDIEGVPDQQFSYLIGLLIRDHKVITHHAFWADAIEDEESIWRIFVDKAKEHPDAPIYHYGSYDVRAIESNAKRFGLDATDICRRLVNLNSQVYAKVYFPVRSNGLKVLGRFLGASWMEPDASGLQSLVWRYRWEMARGWEYKQKLISYNAEDCQALRILTDELARLRTDADAAVNVDYVDQPKQNATDLGTELHTALDQVRLYANFSYRHRRICFRPDSNAPKGKGPGAPKGHQGYQRTVPEGRRTVIRVASKRNCPKHKGERLQKSGKSVERVIVDLNFGNTGCRKVVIKYSGEKRYCPRCKRYYEPPSIQRLRAQTFGHGFRAWAVYQRIILRLPYRMITQAMEDLFHETASEASIINFVDSFGEYYRRTNSALLASLLTSPFVHVDETRLSIRGVDHYVWVFTDGQHVVFRLTETRETTIVRDLLEGFQGVLVTDFYAGYDALDHRQEKCWVHLVRDLNEDLWKFPFDEELQQFVSAVKDLIIPIIEAIHERGMKARYLCRLKQEVDRFYVSKIEDKEYALDVTKKYQKRFVRYRKSLFRFLEEDGIPWNNNTAERAIRHLAVQRKVSGTFHPRGAIAYLELLGIAQTCRFQEKSFLQFLLSKELDVDHFQSPKRIKISKPVNRESL